MVRLVLLSFALFLGVFELVNGVRVCYKCSGEDCQNTTVIQQCPHINNICYTVVHPNTCTVVEKDCAEEGFCNVYSRCESCDTDICNSGVEFECAEPCKTGP